MLTFRFLHRATFQAIAIFLASAAAQAAEVVNLGVPNYNNIILPYFVAVAVRQELTPADMYDFAPMRKAKQELEAKGWTP
jgi:hypothetical protein